MSDMACSPESRGWYVPMPKDRPSRSKPLAASGAASRANCCWKPLGPVWYSALLPVSDDPIGRPPACSPPIAIAGRSNVSPAIAPSLGVPARSAPPPYNSLVRCAMSASFACPS